MAIMQTRNVSTKAGEAVEVTSNAETEGQAVEDIEQWCQDHGRTRADENSPAIKDSMEHGRVYYCLCK